MGEMQFKIDGPKLTEGVPLHTAVAALDHFQKIVDKSYMGITGVRKITAKEREKYFLQTTEIRHGSLLTTFDIMLQGVQLGLPLISAYGPQNIWDATKDTFGFLKTVCTAVQEGKTPSYEFNNEGDATVRIGDEVHHYNGTVIQIGKLSLNNFQDLAHMAGVGKLEEISAGKSGVEAKDLFIGANDSKMFDVPTKLEQEIRSVKCEVFDFNKYKNSGKLSVSEIGQYIPTGEFNFSIFGNQDNVDYIYSMLKPEVELNCLIELAISPFGGEEIHKLHVTGIKVS
ncbi:fructose 1,6-bisphosphatase [Enterovibrio norvegicus]|uniref:fructose 1,6-bisphosphatase n=1 Tax=Enterovibrio norvegicus TaxID=188144 RepID=UPI0024B0C903|nr:fructose 1,6-bisphosphatase [Enterovibrio norvegicus]